MSRVASKSGPCSGQLRVACAVFCVVSPLLGCNLPGKPGNDPEVPRPEAILSFDALYSENCAGCHGANGQGGPATDLANPEYQAWVDDASLRDVIASGRKGSLMPAFGLRHGGNLTDAQVDALVRGMRSSWAKGPALSGDAPPYHAASSGNASAGQAIYTAACARCHGPDARHPGPAGSILDGSFLALINAQTIRTTIVPGRPDIGQPDWHNLIPGRSLNDAEVTDVSAWLIAQAPPHPGHPYPNTPDIQPTTEHTGEQQPLSEKR